MADEADMADDEIMLAHDYAIAKIRRQANEQRRTVNRSCLNCGAPVISGCSFCDQDCQLDHQKRNKMKGY